MKICLIGYGIPCLILANILGNRNIEVSINKERINKKKITTKTIGITKKNIDFLGNEKINLENYSWYINNIKIFTDSQSKKEILNFHEKNKKQFFIIKSYNLFKLLEKNVKKKKSIKFINNSKTNFYNSIIKNKSDFDLVINFSENNKISKEIFFKRQVKNYNSIAYTTIINHKKCDNRIAYQVFSKLGPIAFLPCSNSQTSIVLSLLKKNKEINENEVIELIHNYNKKYFIKSFSGFEKFNLQGSLLKNYYYKNILCFGDNIHKIHPLAGQGLNMTIRDIKILSSLIDQKIDLGLSLDHSILNEFQSQTKHYNYLYASSIDLINEFFKLDNKFNNTYSNKIFSFLDKNYLFKKFSTKFADKGFI